MARLWEHEKSTNDSLRFFDARSKDVQSGAILAAIKPPDVYVGDSGPNLGRGVFAARSFAKDEIVEIAPVLILPDGQQDLPEIIKRRTFSWSKLTGLDDGSTAIVWGYGSMYNHSNPANMQYRADSDHSVMVFSAVRVIQKDEELTINYNAIGGGAYWKDDNWFERHDVTPV